MTASRASDAKYLKPTVEARLELQLYKSFFKINDRGKQPVPWKDSSHKLWAWMDGQWFDLAHPKLSVAHAFLERPKMRDACRYVCTAIQRKGWKHAVSTPFSKNSQKSKNIPKHPGAEGEREENKSCLSPAAWTPSKRCRAAHFSLPHLPSALLHPIC